MTNVYNVILDIGFDSSIGIYNLTVNVSANTSSNCTSSSSYTFLGNLSSGIQCAQWGNLVFQFNPLSTSNFGACALVNWTQKANINPSAIVSSFNESSSSTTTFYNGPQTNFELDIGVSPVYRESFGNQSNVNTYCSSILTDFDFFNNTPSLYVQIYLNLSTSVAANTNLGPTFGGVIGLASSLSSTVTYNVYYTNYNGVASPTISSNGNQYFTFPSTSYSYTNATYNVSNPDNGNLFGLFNPYSATNTTPSGQYNANVDTITLFQLSGNILQSCAAYSETLSTTNPKSTPVYSFMPYGQGLEQNNLSSTGGINPFTYTCAINNSNQSKCDSICLADCSLLNNS